MRDWDAINRLRAETEGALEKLNARRAELLMQMTELQQEKTTFLHVREAPSQPKLASVTDQSSPEAKIALFRSLFRGREDVYAKRFESLKTGKEGYQPVCRNEWVSGICKKPRARCDDCAVGFSFQRFNGVPVDLQFHGVLRAEQQQAADVLLQQETGVLSASTAFGKTVLAACLIAQRKFNTLVVVHRRQLLDQLSRREVIWVKGLTMIIWIPCSWVCRSLGAEP